MIIVWAKKTMLLSEMLRKTTGFDKLDLKVYMSSDSFVYLNEHLNIKRN